MQLPLPLDSIENQPEQISKRHNNGQANKLNPEDRAFHDWYRFVLSFPPHLVRDYLKDFSLNTGDTVLDPFCGTGTTLIEARLAGFCSIGVEANPIAHFASTVKLNWEIDPSGLLIFASEVGNTALNELQRQGLDDQWPFQGDHNLLPLKKLDPQAEALLITNSISPLPLHKTLTLLECLRARQDSPFYRHSLLALAKALVYAISNLRFGPEVGVGLIKDDVPVVESWRAEIRKMARDLELVTNNSYPKSNIFLADARQLQAVLRSDSIDAVITSPPYPNEKDYTRTTRLESVLLGFIKNKAELRGFKESLVRSNTRGIYKVDHDDKWIEGNNEIQRIAEAIEQRRIEMGKTSGFEKLYSQVTRQYFGGMARHFAELRSVLRPGARLAYVVGDQASYLKVMIRTGQLLAGIAESLGYEVVRIDLFRTRFATATKEELREEVVVLHWPGA